MSDDNNNPNASEKGFQSEATDSKLTEVTAQLEKTKADYMYLRAEFDTFRRNTIKERSDLLKYGCERLGQEVLNALDNFERGLQIKINDKNMNDFLKGVELNTNELKNSLSKFGITKIECESKPFDPTLHEALGSEESSATNEGHILRVLRNGYKLHDRLLRPAQVIIAKSPTVN